MVRLIALLTILATAGCVYPYGAPYGGYPYGGYPYGYGGPAPVYAPAYGQQGYAPAATDYNPVSGSRTGSE
jgi:hypothetical protein